MTDTLIVQFELREQVTADAFAEFVTRVDHPHQRQRAICVRFDTFVYEREDGAPLAFEVIEASSRAEWEEAMKGPDQAPISERWSTFVQPDSIREYWVKDAHNIFPRTVDA